MHLNDLLDSQQPIAQFILELKLCAWHKWKDSHDLQIYWSVTLKLAIDVELHATLMFDGSE